VAEQLGEAVLVVTVQDGQATDAINKLRTALSNLSSFSSKESGTASAVGRAIETATDRATASVSRLAETYKRVQTEQQAFVRNARSIAQAQQTAAQEFLSRGVTPLTTTPSAQRKQETTQAREVIQERRTQTRTAQTAGGSGLLGFFRRQTQVEQEVAKAAERRAKAIEDSEKVITRAARNAEKRATTEAKARQSDIQGRISSGLIGGAFPLLFGQGPGAALGGLAGGVAGGGAFGFGASLVGTGIGASFDALIARSKELAEALRDPLAAFEQLKTSSALSSRGLETYIDALIKIGQTAKAEQLIRADLTQNINPITSAALSQANDELARSFSDVQEKLSGLLAGPAIAFLQWLDDIIDRLPIRGPGGAEAGQLPTARQAEAQVDRGVGVKSAGIATIISGILAGAVIGGPAGAVVGGTYAGIGAGVTAFGQSQIAQGEQAQRDLDTQRATAGVQKEIEAIQARRIALQKQLVGFTGDEKSAAAQIAQGQNVVLQAQEDIAKAKAKFLSLPPDATTKENAVAYEELKAAIAAARLEVEKFIAANNNQARKLKRTTDVRERTTGFTSSARQSAQLTDALDRARKDYDKAKAATEAAVGKEAIAAAQSIENNLGQAWRSAAQDLADYNAELAFTAQRQAQVNKLADDKVAQDIKAVQAQRQLLQNAQRTAQIAVQQSTLTQTQGIEAAVNAARQRESDLGDQITTARQRGDETLAANLVAQQKTAANQTRLELEAGALALTNAGIKLREDVQATFLSLQKLRTGPEGLNQFLGAGDRARREQQVFKNILPSFQRAQDQFKLLTGARAAPEFRGPTQAVNESIFRFIDAVNAEQQAFDVASDTQKALSDNTAKLSEVNTDLAAKISELSAKDWNVSVNVAADGTSQTSGDAVNRLFPTTP
jgi:hypothetical protein